MSQNNIILAYLGLDNSRLDYHKTSTEYALLELDATNTTQKPFFRWTRTFEKMCRRNDFFQLTQKKNHV